MSAVILRLPAHPSDCNAVRAAIHARATATAASKARQRRALAVAYDQLRDGSSTAWAIAQGHRLLRGAAACLRSPGGAA